MKLNIIVIETRNRKIIKEIVKDHHQLICCALLSNGLVAVVNAECILFFFSLENYQIVHEVKKIEGRSMRQINKKYLMIACENLLLLLNIYNFSFDTKIVISTTKNIQIFGKMNNGLWLLGERNYNYFIFKEKNFSIKEIGVPKIDCPYYISCLYPKIA